MPLPPTESDSESSVKSSDIGSDESLSGSPNLALSHASLPPFLQRKLEAVATAQLTKSKVPVAKSKDGKMKPKSAKSPTKVSTSVAVKSDAAKEDKKSPKK